MKIYADEIPGRYLIVKDGVEPHSNVLSTIAINTPEADDLEPLVEPYTVPVSALHWHYKLVYLDD